MDVKDGGHDHYVTGTAKYYRRKFDVRPVKITNIRGSHIDDFDISTQGFQFVESPTVGGDFTDTEFVKRVVYPETEELLKKEYAVNEITLVGVIVTNTNIGLVPPASKFSRTFCGTTVATLLRRKSSLTRAWLTTML